MEFDLNDGEKTGTKDLTGEPNPLFRTAIIPQPPHTTRKDQSCFSLQPGHYSSLTAPNLQPIANQGMYSFRFTILINTNSTSNYQSTNETHYTQQNTTITTHKGTQLLTLQRGVTGTARMLHALTHSSISRQVREQM